MAWLPTNRIVIAIVLCLLIGSLAGCSCAPRYRGTYLPAAVDEAAAGWTRTVLWFRGPAGEAVPITRDLPESRARIWTAIEALSVGPAPDSGLEPAIPVGVHLRKVVHRPADDQTIISVDLDFEAAFAKPDGTQLEAINRTLSQFSDIGAARVLAGGIPVMAADAPGVTEPLLLRPPSALALMQFVPVQAGSRLYLAARGVADVQPSGDFDAAAGRLIDAAYIRTLLPRGAKVTWAATPVAGTRSVAVTIELRSRRPTERDWQTVQVAADALALTLRTIPGTAAVNVTVVGQERTFSYPGSIWPNPEPTATAEPRR